MILAAVSADVPIYVAIAGPLIAVGYLLWRVQHSMISPMDKRLGTLERSNEYERQERLVCEWRHTKLVRWLRDGHASGEAVPDELIYARPSWAHLADPLESDGKK